MVDIEKELAVIVVRNKAGQTNSFPLTEMVFNQEGNLLDYLICPSEVDANIKNECQDLAKKIIEAFEMVGILAVELFLTKDGRILINEVAPRTHNSGHHTINANVNSQFNLHLRSILNLELGNTSQLRPYAAMINVLGDPSTDQGSPDYNGLDQILDIGDVFPHIYGKKVVKPLRKMGHVNIIADSKKVLIEKINNIKQTLNVKHEQ